MIENFEILSKWIVASASILTVLLRVLDSLSRERRKKSLIQDIELIDSLLKSADKEIEGITTELLQKKIDEFIELSNARFKWFDTLYALLLFTAFGYWTIYLFNKSSEFDPWSIITALISIVGLGLFLDPSYKSKEKNRKFLELTILKDMVTGIVMFLISSISIAIMILRIEGYTNWYIGPVIILLLSLKVFNDSIEIKKARTPTKANKTCPSGHVC